jgi:hypothetical protein
VTALPTSWRKPSPQPANRPVTSSSMSVPNGPNLRSCSWSKSSFEPSPSGETVDSPRFCSMARNLPSPHSWIVFSIWAHRASRRRCNDRYTAAISAATSDVNNSCVDSRPFDRSEIQPRVSSAPRWPYLSDAGIVSDARWLEPSVCGRAKLED